MRAVTWSLVSLAMLVALTGDGARASTTPEANLGCDRATTPTERTIRDSPDGPAVLQTAAQRESEMTSAVHMAASGDPRDAAPAPPAPPAPLTGTRWRLVEIESMDDTVGTTRPPDPSRYTLALASDGTVAMRLDCNRATGRWSATPAADPASGSFRIIGPLAMTRAMCPPPSLDTRVARDMAYVRSYLLKDGRLHLTLMADGGIYTWEPF